MNKFLLAIPALSDFITSTLQYVALNFISGSVYQMLRGGAIVTTFIFSIIFLKIKVKRCQIAGAAMALFGVIVVGISNVAFK
jgi:drug/metabolite transporter (DMT)-like permease